jgi:putative hydrolase of the HAD superfamily
VLAGALAAVRYRSKVANRGVIFWDFDYTLGFRGPEAVDDERHPWGHCVLEMLDDEDPDHGACLDTVRAPLHALHDVFPWNAHHEPHPHLSDANAWWKNVEPVFAHAFEVAGITRERAWDLARRFRHEFADASRWSLYPDTVPVLERLADAGWHHVIVSNHVPELNQIIRGLRLDALVDQVVCSAQTGYEKPHPEAFRIAMRLRGHPEHVWMVGDNPVADVVGAEAVGIPAIQVRMCRGDNVRRYSRDLDGVIDIIRAGPG